MNELKVCTIGFFTTSKFWIVNFCCLQMMKTLNGISPYFVNLHYSFPMQQNLCLVMDFVQGGDLFSFLKKSEVSIFSGLKWFSSNIFIYFCCCRNH